MNHQYFHEYIPDIECFFELLCGKTDEKSSEEVIQTPVLLQAFCNELLGRTDEQYQITILERITAMVKKYYQNAAICMHYEIHYYLLSFMSVYGFNLFSDEKALFTFQRTENNSSKQKLVYVASLPLPFLKTLSNTIESSKLRLMTQTVLADVVTPSYLLSKKILNLFLHILKLSVSFNDFYYIFNVFKPATTDEAVLSRRTLTCPDERLNLYFTTLEILSRNVEGPTSFFYLLGEHTPLTTAAPTTSSRKVSLYKSGLLLPEKINFPSSGYSFICWIRLERPPSGKASAFYSFRGMNGGGIAAFFQNEDLIIEVYGSRKQKLIIPKVTNDRKWQCFAITHIHRTLWNSKLDVYIDGQLKHSGKLAYPNDINPIQYATIGIPLPNSEAEYLKAELGPIGLFQGHLSTISSEEMTKRLDKLEEYMCNASYAPKNINVPTTNEAASSQPPSSSSGIPSFSSLQASNNTSLVFAYDARNVDALRGIIYDFSPNRFHARFASPDGSFTMRTSSLKECSWQLGGVITWFPVLATQVPLSVKEKIIQHMDPKCFIQNISIIAELLRNSPINKFLWKRTNGVRLLAHVIDALDGEYLTKDLFECLDYLCGSVSSDAYLKDQIRIHITYNLDIWSKATAAMQEIVLKSFEHEIITGEIPQSMQVTRLLCRALYNTYTTTNKLPHLSDVENSNLRTLLFDLLECSLRDHSQRSTDEDVKPPYLLEEVKTILCICLDQPVYSKGAEENEHPPEEEMLPFFNFLERLFKTASDSIVTVLSQHKGITMFFRVLEEGNNELQTAILRLMRFYLCFLSREGPGEVRNSFEARSSESFGSLPPQDGYLQSQYELLGAELARIGDFESNVFIELFNIATLTTEETSFTLKTGVYHCHLNDTPFLSYFLTAIESQGTLAVRYLMIMFFRQLFSVRAAYREENLVTLWSIDTWLIRILNIGCFNQLEIQKFALDAEKYLREAPSTSLVELPDLSKCFPLSEEVSDDEIIAKLKGAIEIIQQDSNSSKDFLIQVTNAIPLCALERQCTLRMLIDSLILLDPSYLFKQVWDDTTKMLADIFLYQFYETENAWLPLLDVVTSSNLVHVPYMIPMDDKGCNDETSRHVVYLLFLHLISEMRQKEEQEPITHESMAWNNIEQFSAITCALVLHYDSAECEAADDKFWSSSKTCHLESLIIEHLLEFWNVYLNELDAEFDVDFTITSRSKSSRTPTITSSGTPVANPPFSNRHWAASPMSPRLDMIENQRAMKGFPGGIIRQILLLSLRSFYILYYTNQENVTTSFDKLFGRLCHITKTLGLSNELSIVYDVGSFSGSVTAPSGLIYKSDILKTPPGPSTCIMLWLIMELSVFRDLLTDLTDATKHTLKEGIFEYIQSLLMSTVSSDEELHRCIASSDFIENEGEIKRRDRFFKEQIELLREKKVKELAATSKKRMSSSRSYPEVRTTTRQDRWILLKEAESTEIRRQLIRTLESIKTLSFVWQAEFGSRTQISNVYTQHIMCPSIDRYTSSAGIRKRIIAQVQQLRLVDGKYEPESLPGLQDFKHTTFDHEYFKEETEEEAKSETSFSETRGSFDGSFYREPPPPPLSEPTISKGKLSSPAQRKLKGRLSSGMKRIRQFTPKSFNKEMMKNDILRKVGTKQTSSMESMDSIKSTPTNITSFGYEEERTLQTNAFLVFPELMVRGMFMTRHNTLVFEGTSLLSHLNGEFIEVKDALLHYLKRRVWGVRIISAIYRRTIQCSLNGIELFFVDGANCLLAFEQNEVITEVLEVIRSRRPLCLPECYFAPPMKLLEDSHITKRWKERKMSNFQYLMYLNFIAGRSYNLTCQYPIFPWIIADYTSSNLDLTDSKTYRNLTLPMSAQLDQDSQEKPELISRPDLILRFLRHLSPYTYITSNTPSISSMAEFYTNACKESFEVFPEFYYLAELFNSELQLPPWASSPDQFILLNRMALESEYVSEHLHEWIDFIFGIHATDLENLQLFTSSHPKRSPLEETLSRSYSSIHENASLSSSSQLRKLELRGTVHVVGVASVCFVTQQSLGYSIDENGVVQIYKYMNNKRGVQNFPASIEPLETLWKLPAGCCPNLVNLFYDYLISGGYWDGSWRITWADDGELLQRICLQQRITCMTCSHDNVTGDLAVAFGSEDGTISVWALAKVKAMKSQKKRFSKSSPVGTLPWVLLTGQCLPINCIALNVELDVVVSGSNAQLIIYSLRDACALHSFTLPKLDPNHTAIAGLAISSYGDIIAHAIMQGISYLYLISMNGRITNSYCIASEVKEATRLLPMICFSKCGHFFITATAGRYGGIDVRATNTLMVLRRIESKPVCHITCFTLSEDERCILAGYQDGSIIAYGSHYGIFYPCMPSLYKTTPLETSSSSSEVMEIKPLTSTIPLAPEVLSCFNHWYHLLKTPCNEEDELYEAMITEIFTILCPQATNQGLELGFQRNNPITDFRAGGMLSLTCLLHFAQNCKTQALDMMGSNIPGTRPNTYPFGPVAINITCMLSSILWDRHGKVVEACEIYSSLFYEEVAFYDLFSITFCLFDQEWKTSSAHYGLFTVVLDEIKMKVLACLEECPSSLQTLNHLLGSPLQVELLTPYSDTRSESTIGATPRFSLLTTPTDTGPLEHAFPKPQGPSSVALPVPPVPDVPAADPLLPTLSIGIPSTELPRKENVTDPFAILLNVKTNQNTTEETTKEWDEFDPLKK